MHFNLFQNEAVDMPQNCSLWILMFTFLYYVLLLVHMMSLLSLIYVLAVKNTHHAVNEPLTTDHPVMQSLVCSVISI